MKSKKGNSNLDGDSHDPSVERLKRRLYSPLPRAELILGCVIWVCMAGKAIYSIYLASQRYSNHFYSVTLKAPWWTFLTGPLNMDEDYEWLNWKATAMKMGILVILFPVISEFVKTYFPKHVVLLTGAYSVASTWWVMSWTSILFILTKITIMYAVYKTNWTILVWTAAMTFSISLSFNPFRHYIDSYLGNIFLAWITARCVSFSIDRINGHVPKEKTLLEGLMKLIAFSFYLPLGIMGPLITSEEYEESLHTIVGPKDRKYWQRLVLQSVRYFVWYLVAEISLAVIFQEGFVHRPDLVNSLDLWTLCGLGYMLGQFFHLKYVVMYGISCLVASFDGVKTPPHPKCIARIHLYSDMWRYFDTGLYNFMHKYIYSPITGRHTSTLVSLFASFVCFSFVFVWHGTYDFVLTWSCLNFAGIAMESLAKKSLKNVPFIKKFESNLNPSWQRRLHAAAASPIFIMSALSNFYFFAGMEVGNIFVRRILLESWPKGFPTILIAMYFCSQTSIEMKNYEINREIAALSSIKKRA